MKSGINNCNSFFHKNLKKTEQQRTSEQNRALHKFLKIIADWMLDHGITLNLLIREIEIYPNEKNLKDIFRAIGKTKFNINSTADLTTKEMCEVIDIFETALKKIGIEIDFPSQEKIELLSYYSKNKYK